MAVSILDVAKMAGVSRMTVSRVVGNSGSVSESTRLKVLEVIRRLGYVPSASARAMRSKDALLANESLCIALIFSSDTQTGESFFSSVTKAAEREAARHGLSVLQSHWQESFEKTWPRLKSLFAVSGVCGAVLAGQFSSKEINAIHKFTPNLVILDASAPDDLSISSVESDYILGSSIAVQHLLDRDVRRLLVLTGPSEEHYFAKAIVKGLDGLRNKFERSEVLYCDLSSNTGYKIIRNFFSESVDYDGIFCSDELAIGALRAFSELKIEVPKQVKVVGFDDINHSAFLSPSLTTVSIDKTQLGREAVSTLVEIVKGKKELKNMKKILTAKIVVRESA